MDTGVVFNIQRFSVHDGPGIRTTVFFKGCPLSCWWCHNPEGRDPESVISLLAERCIGCESCIESCPHGVARPLDRNPGRRTDAGECVRCGACAEACPSGARTVVGDSRSVRDLVKELDRDRIFYDESGGGVTFSGGEPLAPGRNAKFLLSCLEACRDRGYHRTVDTSGFAPRETLLSAAALTDLFLFDIKHMDDERHRQCTGVSNRPILENLRALSRLGSNVWVRVPLIPGVNDDQDNLDATASLVASLDQPCPLHLLPYHRVGGDKHRRLGSDDPLRELEPSLPEQIRNAADRFRSLGLKVTIGG